MYYRVAPNHLLGAGYWRVVEVGLAEATEETKNYYIKAITKIDFPEEFGPLDAARAKKMKEKLKAIIKPERVTWSIPRKYEQWQRKKPSTSAKPYKSYNDLWLKSSRLIFKSANPLKPQRKRSPASQRKYCQIR
jgi:hypothetical protein